MIHIVALVMLRRYLRAKIGSTRSPNKDVTRKFCRRGLLQESLAIREKALAANTGYREKFDEPRGIVKSLMPSGWKSATKKFCKPSRLFTGGDLMIDIRRNSLV